MQSAQIIIINGTLREIGAFLLLSRRAHLLTTAPRGGGGIPPFGRAVRSARRIALCGERQTMPPSLRALVVIACTAGRSVFARFPASPQTVVLSRDNLPPACENLPLAALSQLWTMLPRTVHFLLSRQKKQNRPIRGQKGSERLWQSITWKQRW